ncbi:hypothetical protein L596_030799 [Steinernema carpocapsae]|uniref:F-box domain-containing protein n=1 Tax=Steinernema carpocapsae TaxID=34508 RepID=A0A4U5LNU6_STECR|nr:hypothetical protein L596_030799 [Steinernema carpocapsae]
MEDVPYSFCSAVLPYLHINKIDELQSILNASVWKDACSHVTRCSTKLYILCSDFDVQYFFTQTTSSKHSADYDKNYSMTDLLKIGFYEVRIKSVDIGATDKIKNFAKDGSWPTDFSNNVNLRRFIAINLQSNNATLNVTSADHFQNSLKPILNFFANLFVHNLTLHNGSSVMCDFLASQLQNTHIFQLCLYGSWPATILTVLRQHFSKNVFNRFCLPSDPALALDQALFDKIKNCKKYRYIYVSAPFELKCKDNPNFVGLTDTVCYVNLCVENDL